jgi:hypothetical protein
LKTAHSGVAKLICKVPKYINTNPTKNTNKKSSTKKVIEDCPERIPAEELTYEAALVHTPK